MNPEHYIKLLLTACKRTIDKTTILQLFHRIYFHERKSKLQIPSNPSNAGDKVQGG